MATLVLGTVGGVIGGAVGRAVGAVAGGVADRLLFGGSRRREGLRLSDLAVQGSTYGEALPRLYGTVRVAGQVIWSTGLKETARTTGGKRTGGRTTTYSYSASFAVALSARPIHAIRRIWADGKLLRGSAGEFVMPAVMRVHLGREGQAVDPLIAAAEEAGAAPAYRGLAYVVFEELPLGDFANRVPNLSFEVEADAGPVAVGAIVEDLCAAAGIERPEAAAAGEPVKGFTVGRNISVRTVIEMLSALAPFSVRDDDGRLRFGSDEVGGIAEADLGATSGDAAERQREQRSAADALPDEIAVGFFDTERDYQPGLQRARRRSSGGMADSRELPVGMTAAEGKRVAERLLSEAWGRRTQAVARLPWRHARLQPGDIFEGADGIAWRVRRWTMEGLGIALDAERTGGVRRMSLPPGEAGRSLRDIDAPAGATVLHALDLPPLPGESPTAPRLWLAAAGTGEGWRRAEILASADGGETYSSVATIGPTVVGQAVGVLGAGPCERWDRRSSVEVELLNDAMWLESRSTPSVLAGANLALLGDEIVQFANAAATGPRRFRLSLLLRGRRATEAAVASHVAGERFVLLSPEGLTAFEAPLGVVGGILRMKAVGPHELAGEVAAREITIYGRALRPLPPVHLRARREMSGDVRLTWVRRSRHGFEWLDGIDAPLAEEREAYRIRIHGDGAAERVVETSMPEFLYTTAAQVADGVNPDAELHVQIAQLGSSVGAGDAALQQFLLPAN